MQSQEFKQRKYMYMENMINWRQDFTDVDGHGQQHTIARPTGRSAINVVDLATMQGCVLPGPHQLQTPRDKDVHLAAPRGENVETNNSPTRSPTMSHQRTSSSDREHFNSNNNDHLGNNVSQTERSVYCPRIRLPSLRLQWHIVHQ